MKAWQQLMIRACKSNHLSHRTLRRIFGAKCALPLCCCPLHYAVHGLMEIIKEFDLVDDWEKFMIETERHRNGKFYFTEPKTFTEAMLHQAASVIRMTEVSEFPEYRRPARFRNRE